MNLTTFYMLLKQSKTKFNYFIEGGWIRGRARNNKGLPYCPLQTVYKYVTGDTSWSGSVDGKKLGIKPNTIAKIMNGADTPDFTNSYKKKLMKILDLQV